MTRTARFPALLLMLALLGALLAACGSQPSTPPAESTSAPAAEATSAPAAEATSAPAAEGGNAGPFTIGISNGFVGSEWRTQMITDLEQINAEYMAAGLTTELEIESADTDVPGQTQQIRNLINKGVDAIIINPQV